MPNFDEEIASSMMEANNEMPIEENEEAAASEDSDIILNIADELSTLTQKEITPEQVDKLVNAIIEDEGEEEAPEGEPAEAKTLPDDFS